MTSDVASLERMVEMLEELATGLKQVMPAVRRHHQSLADLTERIAADEGYQGSVLGAELRRRQVFAPGSGRSNSAHTTLPVSVGSTPQSSAT